MVPSLDSSSSAGTDGTRVIKTVRFRRGRATKACEVCHARKVRCDMTENFPCTNCKAFSLVCVPREGRGKGRKSDSAQQQEETANNASYQQFEQQSVSPPPRDSTPIQNDASSRSGDFVYIPEGLAPSLSACESKHQLSQDTGNRHSGRFIDSWREGTNSSGEQPEDEFIMGILKRGIEKGSLPRSSADEISVRVQGSFLLPSPELSDHLVGIYFRYIHPYIPVVNRNEFMTQYKKDRDSPSLLLRQAIYCVASRYSDHPDLVGPSGSSRFAALTFYRRAKALYDIRFDGNIELSITAAIILSLAVDNPLYMDQNGYYWVRVAAAQAKGVGLHRKLRSETTPQQRSRWRRIWWTLYKRDISTAMAYGRPIAINLEDCDIEMISVDDFIDSEGPIIEPGSDAELTISYFIHSVRLHEILALIMRVQFTVGAERLRRLHLLPDVTQCDRALAEWVTQLPLVLTYSIKDEKRYHYVRALLYLEYYTVVCLSHRPQVSHLFKVDGWQNFPTWNIAFQAAHMICKILENFQNHNELRKLPGFSVYSCFSALIMMSFQRRVSRENDNVVKSAVKEGLISFQKLCKELSKTHTTGSWIMQLAVELQSEESSKKLVRSINAPSKSHLRAPPPNSKSREFSGLALATGPPPPTSTITASTPNSVNPTSSASVPRSKNAIATPKTSPPSSIPGYSTLGTASSTIPVISPHPAGPGNIGQGGGGTNIDHSSVNKPAPSDFTSRSEIPNSVSDAPAPTTEQQQNNNGDPFDPLNSIMTPRTASVTANDLFPQDIGFFDFPESINTNSSMSSGDDSAPEMPDTMNMVDWYDFLNAGPLFGDEQHHLEADI